MKRRAAEVESCLQEMKDVSESIDALARMEIASLDIQDIVLETDCGDDGDQEVDSNLDETTLAPR